MSEHSFLRIRSGGLSQLCARGGNLGKLVGERGHEENGKLTRTSKYLEWISNEIHFCFLIFFMFWSNLPRSSLVFGGHVKFSTWSSAHYWKLLQSGSQCGEMIDYIRMSIVISKQALWAVYYIHTSWLARLGIARLILLPRVLFQSLFSPLGPDITLRKNCRADNTSGVDKYSNATNFVWAYRGLISCMDVEEK